MSLPVSGTMVGYTTEHKEGTSSMATMQRSKLRQSLQTWKNKAIHRRKQLKQANKRLRELGQSRDQWKRKAQAGQARIVALQAENRRLRQRMDTAEKKPLPGLVDTPTVS